MGGSRFRLETMAQSAERSSKRLGVYIAIVTANTDEGDDSGYRVKVRYPWLPDDEESYWARILTPMAGNKRGAYFLPEAEDQVMVVFEHGDIQRPIVIGSIWSQAQKPPQRNDDGKNDIKVIKSKSGFRLIFDDTQGAERLVMVDATKKNKIVLDAGADELLIQSSGDIELVAKKAIKIHGKTLKMTASTSLKADGKSMSVSGQTLDFGADGEIAIKGGNVSMNPGGPPAAAQQQSGGGDGGRGAQDGGSQVAVVAAAVGVAAVGTFAVVAIASPGARNDASSQHLPDTATNPPAATVGASPGVDEIHPGQPVKVTAVTDAPKAEYVVRDTRTGKIVGGGPCNVEDGEAEATWDSGSLEEHPETNEVEIEIKTDEGSSSTGPIPVAGRDKDPLGGESPSNALADPTAPMPDGPGGQSPPDAGLAGGQPPGAEGAAPIGDAAPTVDDKGRAVDTPRGAQHAAGAAAQTAQTPGGAGGAGRPGDQVPHGTGGVAAGDRDPTGDSPPGTGAAGVKPAGAGQSVAGAGAAAAGPGAGAKADRVRDPSASAQASAPTAGGAERAAGDAQAAADDPAGAAGGGSSGGGQDPKLGHAAVAASEGDAAGAAGFAAGDQVEAAARGDASGAVGGGTAGQVVDGDVKGAAVGESGADPRANRIDSVGDAQNMAENEAESAGREGSGLNEAQREQRAAENQVASERRDAEYQTDPDAQQRRVESDAQSDVRAETRDARQAEYEANRDVRHAESDATTPPGESESMGAENDAHREMRNAERDVRAPEREADQARYEADRDTRDARDPEGAADREMARERQENIGEAEADSRKAQRTADDPDREAKDRVKKLDDD